MDRRPPSSVRKALRKEVGLGCPVAGCGSPFLEWHHFDPPWSKENHHRPEGMIALCHEHHAHADGGAFTIEQLRDFKLNGLVNNEQVRAKFHWLRNKLLAIVGGNFYYDVPVILLINGRKEIWFEHDDEGNFLLNFDVLTITDQHRAYMDNNEFFATGTEIDIIAPPSGKELSVAYENGDKLKFEFKEFLDRDSFLKKHPDGNVVSDKISFPLTTVEITFKVAGTDLNFSPKGTTLGSHVIRGCYFEEGGAGISLNITRPID